MQEHSKHSHVFVFLINEVIIGSLYAPPNLLKIETISIPTISIPLDQGSFTLQNHVKEIAKFCKSQFFRCSSVRVSKYGAP